MDELWLEIENQYKDQLKKISNQIIRLMQEAIQETIYDESDPIKTWWDRTGNFKDSVDAKIDEDGDLIVYINTDKLDYYSWINYKQTDKEISSILPWLLEEGHHGDYGYGMYKNYEGRHYLEVAQEKIKEEFPELEIVIINEQPERI